MIDQKYMKRFNKTTQKERQSNTMRTENGGFDINELEHQKKQNEVHILAFSLLGIDRKRPTGKLFGKWLCQLKTFKTNWRFELTSLPSFRCKEENCKTVQPEK